LEMIIMVSQVPYSSHKGVCCLAGCSSML